MSAVGAGLLAGLLVLALGAGVAPGTVVAQRADEGAGPSPSTAVSQALIPVGAADAAPAELRITAEDEPGQPLRITGRVVDAVSGAPTAGATLVVYQADDGGEYEPADPADESSARLRGELTTDAAGRFALWTIMPGEYPGQPPGNRHIHVHSVSAEGYLPRGLVILFEGNVRDEIRSWAGDTGFGQVIETTESGGWRQGSIEILLEPFEDSATDTRAPAPSQDPASP